MAHTARIPQTDPRAGYLAHRDEIDAAVWRALGSGHYILGHEVDAFEAEFAAFCGTAHGIGVASGTDALVLALRALGVGPGHAVVTVSHTAVATVAAIQQAGATPLLIDVDDAYGMDPEELEAVLRGPCGGLRPGAIMPVHLYGQPADMDVIGALSNRFGVPIVEDCSQAHGAEWRGRRVGGLGAVAAFSLYPTKNLGAFGDGGILTTDDPVLAERLRALRQYGWRERRVSEFAGMNSRLDEVQAAILRVRLGHLEAGNCRRRWIAHCYDQALGKLPLVLPQRREGGSHVFHQYVIALENRDAVQAALLERAIMTNIHYPVPIHLQPAYHGRVPLGPRGLSRTEARAARILSLPIYPELSLENVEQVGNALSEVLLCQH